MFPPVYRSGIKYCREFSYSARPRDVTFFPVFVYRYLILEYIFFQGNKETPSMKKKNWSRAKSHRTLWNLKQNKFVRKYAKEKGIWRCCERNKVPLTHLSITNFAKLSQVSITQFFLCFLERQQSCQTYSFLEKIGFF